LESEFTPLEHREAQFPYLAWIHDDIGSKNFFSPRFHVFFIEFPQLFLEGPVGLDLMFVLVPFRVLASVANAALRNATISGVLFAKPTYLIVAFAIDDVGTDADAIAAPKLVVLDVRLPMLLPLPTSDPLVLVPSLHQHLTPQVFVLTIRFILEIYLPLYCSKLTIGSQVFKGTKKRPPEAEISSSLFGVSIADIL
jgi:hypothetical protein